MAIRNPLLSMLALVSGLTMLGSSPRLLAQQPTDSAQAAKQLIVAALWHADSLMDSPRPFATFGRVAFERDSVRFYSAERSVVPGLSYLSGLYVPPKTADIVYRAAAGFTADTAFPLQQATAVMRAARSLGWWPDGLATAAAFCGELVRYTGHRFVPRNPPMIFTTWSRLSGEISLDSSDVHQLHQAGIAPPSMAYQSARQVIVSLWAVEEDVITRRYDCRLYYDGRASLTVRDSVRVGFVSY